MSLPPGTYNRGLKDSTGVGDKRDMEQGIHQPFPWDPGGACETPALSGGSWRRPVSPEPPNWGCQQPCPSPAAGTGGQAPHSAPPQVRAVQDSSCGQQGCRALGLPGLPGPGGHPRGLRRVAGSCCRIHPPLFSCPSCQHGWVWEHWPCGKHISVAHFCASSCALSQHRLQLARADPPQGQMPLVCLGRWGCWE